MFPDVLSENLTSKGQQIAWKIINYAQNLGVIDFQKYPVLQAPEKVSSWIALNLGSRFCDKHLNFFQSKTT